MYKGNDNKKGKIVNSSFSPPFFLSFSFSFPFLFFFFSFLFFFFHFFFLFLLLGEQLRDPLLVALGHVDQALFTHVSLLGSNLFGVIVSPFFSFISFSSFWPKMLGSSPLPYCFSICFLSSFFFLWTNNVVSSSRQWWWIRQVIVAVTRWWAQLAYRDRLKWIKGNLGEAKLTKGFL